jgi:DNA-binding Lrp family transcriptional regulator
VTTSINEIAHDHGLTPAEVIAEIENLLSAQLSHQYKADVAVFCIGGYQLEAVIYRKQNGGITQQTVNLDQMHFDSYFRQQIRHRIARAAIIKETVYYKAFERQSFWGTIRQIDKERNFHIELEIDADEPILALCPLNRIGVHERNGESFTKGSRRAFHLRKIEPVLSNGTPKLKITVDRTSKTLVENLLREQLGNTLREVRIRCVKRYVGHRSIVLTALPLPKPVIVAVDRELKERIQVKFVDFNKPYDIQKQINQALDERRYRRAS